MYVGITEAADMPIEVPSQQHTEQRQIDASLPARPNIIFMLADDLGYGDVGYNGGRAYTPNLDAMARGSHSIQFRRFYSGAPVCSPTRGTLLTGRNHNRYCVYRANTSGRECRSQDLTCPAKMPLPTSEVTVAELLKEAGYRTAVFGKWHLGDLLPLPNGHPKWPTSTPSQHGFDEWKVTERAVPTATPNCGCFDEARCILGHYRSRGPMPCTNYHSNDRDNPSGVVAHGEPIRGDDSQFIADQVESFLEGSSNSTQPFFMYIAFHAVHKKFIAVPPYMLMFRNLSRESRDYFGTILAMDVAVGQIRALLQQYNISNNTMLWFGSDNGPEDNTDGDTRGLKGRKGTLFEGGIRVPGILEWPERIHHNKATDYPVVTNDFLPTVCDVLGISKPARQLDGISILPLIQGDAVTRPETIKWEFINRGGFNSTHHLAILENQYKVFARYRNGRLTGAQMYDLSTDRTEDIDISANYPKKHAQLLQELEAWRNSVISSAQEEVECYDYL